MRLFWILNAVLVGFAISQLDLYFLGLHLPNSPTAAHTTQARGNRKTPPALAHKKMGTLVQMQLYLTAILE